MVDGKLQNTTSEAISASYNEDRFSPVDGELVKAADHQVKNALYSSCRGCA